MKKIIFLFIFSISFLYSGDCYNSATDKLTVSTLNYGACRPLTEIHYNSITDIEPCTDNYVVKWYGEAYTNYCTDSSYFTNKKYYQQIYSFSRDYSCPDGQEIINGICTVPPTCATGTLWNPLTDICEYDPNTADSNSNGIPDKCDPDYIDYLTLDCNSDGEANGVDDDIDGDGILNGNDPTPYGSASGTADTPCPSSSYSFLEGSTQSVCSLDNPIFIAPDYEIQYVSNVYWDSCRNKCGFKKLYCPSGKAIKNGVCTSIEPDEGDCLGTKDCSISGISSGDSSANSYCSKRCYCLTTQFPTRSPDNLYFEKEVSCTENIGDTNTLENLRSSNDVNKTLPADLLKDSNATASLDVSASMKVALDSYAGSKEATQLELLSESKIQSLQLVSANTNLKNIESSLEKFSAVSTSNDGVINSSLQGIKGGIDTSNGLLGSIDGKMTTNNSLLGDIKGLLGDLNTSGGGDSNITIGGTSFSDKHEEGEQQAIDRGNIDGSLTQIYTFLNNVSNDFTNLKNMLDGGITSPSISSGIAPTFCVTVFNRQICINLCESFGQFYSIFYYIFTSLFLLVALKIYYLAFKMRF